MVLTVLLCRAYLEQRSLDEGQPPRCGARICSAGEILGGGKKHTKQQQKPNAVFSKECVPQSLKAHEHISANRRTGRKEKLAIVIDKFHFFFMKFSMM